MRQVILAGPRPEVRSLRIAQPLVRPSSRLEVSSVLVLTLTALALWCLVLPLEVLAALAR